MYLMEKLRSAGETHWRFKAGATVLKTEELGGGGRSARS
jgi:hypothetical protein